ncbi:MAG: hypothetical protein OER88_07405, partial [Planctomycetota bacterium]|nr:hypothetical protein [Planctomycetota bacterium]
MGTEAVIKDWRTRLGELAAALAETDYESSEAVASHNAAFDEMRALILRVGRASASSLDALLSLLTEEPLRVPIAFTLPDGCRLTEEQRERCLVVIREVARGDGPDALGAPEW